MNNEAGTSEVFPDWGGLSESVTSVYHDDSSPSPVPGHIDWLYDFVSVSVGLVKPVSDSFRCFYVLGSSELRVRPGWQTGQVTTRHGVGESPHLSWRQDPILSLLKWQQAHFRCDSNLEKHSSICSHHIKVLDLCLGAPVSLVCLHLITFDSSNGPCSTLGLIRPSLPLPPLMSLCVPCWPRVTCHARRLMTIWLLLMFVCNNLS